MKYFMKRYLYSIFTVLSIGICFPIFSQSSQVYTVPGTYTWTVPACVYSITVEVWGGGGGGGAVWSRFSVTANASDCESGDEICTGAGGGGGGGYSRRTYTVNPGEVYTIVVGAGGNGGVINNGVGYSSASVGPAQNGSTGGNSTFSGPATAATGTLTAFGGGGGQCANIQRSCLGGCGFNHNGEFGVGGTGGGGTNGTTTFTGGNGAAGSHSASTNDKSGGGGGGAGSSSNGGNASTTSGGTGGATGGGNGANGIVQPYGTGYLGTNGANGSAIGGGGSGASSHHETSCSSTNAQSRVGGNGARGEVRIAFDTGSQPTPVFDPVSPICSGQNLSPLPTTSNNGISGTWSPVLNNTATTTYTFTPSSGQCASTATLTITVNPPTNVPQFDPVAPVCAGSTLAPLPTTSNNGINGTWSPALNNSTTTVYTFTPSSGQCATTASLSISVTQPAVPTFNAPGNYCVGANVDPLPIVSNEGYTGVWSPSINNTVTTVYTFTSDAGQCAGTNTLTVAIGPPVVPTFNAISPVCSGTILNPLPTSSLEGIQGAWSPSPNNSATTVYTFTPSSGQCAQTTTTTVEVQQPVTPIFQQVPGICSGDPLNPLPAVSLNGISGAWSPALNNLATTLYTFSPASGQCATDVSMTINVNPQSTTPLFDQVGELCQGAAAPVLPVISLNGIAGTWSPLVSTSTPGVQSYLFTPDAGSCGSTTSMDITVVSTVVPVFTPLDPICQGSVPPVLSSVSTNGINGQWSGAVDSSISGIQNFTFEPNSGECATPAGASIQIIPLPTINAGPDQVLCLGQNATLSASGATTYTWNNGAVNGIEFSPQLGTTTYTVSGTNDQGCTGTDQVVISVNPVPQTFAGNDQILCEGEQITLNGTGAITYAWSGGVSNNVPFTAPVGVNSYTVTGTNSFGCTSSDQIQLTVIDNVLPSFVSSGSGCAPLELTLQSTGNSTGCVWELSNGQTLTGCNVTVSLDMAGCYDITLSTLNNGCTASFTSLSAVCVEEPPVADFIFNPTQLTTLDTYVQFTNTSINASSYVWNFGDASDNSSSVNPSHEFPSAESGEYEVVLVAFSPSGCADTANATVTVSEELIFYVPNAFTPDADNYNPVFMPVFTAGFDPMDYHLTIFNRWGEIVFESYDHTVGWNGTFGAADQNRPCQDGVYTWKIQYSLLLNDAVAEVVGHVNLIR
ncbi:MAG: hypothetical protein RIT43_16 [Bacteroidota bacterium]